MRQMSVGISGIKRVQAISLMCEKSRHMCLCEENIGAVPFWLMCFWCRGGFFMRCQNSEIKGKNIQNIFVNVFIFHPALPVSFI